MVIFSACPLLTATDLPDHTVQTNSIKMVDGPNSSTNHPTTATSGGASAKPTPANNAGGGSGWGDPGFVKGGTTKASDTGLGHVAVCG
jgi:hypothetical protein